MLFESIFICFLASSPLVVHAENKGVQQTPAKESQKQDQLIKEANQFRKEKKYKEASDLYGDLLKLDPQNVDYALALGRLYVTLQRIDEAILIYEKALTIQPKRQDIQTALAFAYLFQNKLENSQTLFQAVLAEDPNNADAFAGLGNIAQKRDQLSESESYLQKALQIDEKNITALIYFAHLKMKQKDYQAANEIYRKAALIDATDPDVIQGLLDVHETMLVNEAQQLLKDKNYNEAVKNFLCMDCKEAK